jgi:colicin import membrane protein
MRHNPILRPIALLLAFAGAAGSIGCQREEKLPPPIVWTKDAAAAEATEAPSSEATIRQVAAPRPAEPATSSDAAAIADRNARWAEQKRLDDQRSKLDEEKKALEEEKKKLSEEKAALEAAKKELEAERQRLAEERRKLEEQRQQTPVIPVEQPKVEPPPAA